MIANLPEKAFAATVEEILSHLETSLEQGLSQTEAGKRLNTFGKNRLKKQQSKPVILIFLEQFLDPVIYVLVAATVLGFAFGEIVEGVAVVVVILITVFIGFFMEWQARRSMEALREMTRGESYVLRDGQEMLIEDICIVPGDILLLTSGEFVPADGRVAEHESLAVKESALTGESFQVNKLTEHLPETTMLADRENMVFNGTMVTRGTAKVVVTATGEQTELGKISKMTQEADDEQTPIEKKLNVLSKKLIWLTLFLAIAIALVGYVQGRELVQMIETAFALAVAAIPEGLPIVATIALARGMLRLAKDRAIIKQLRSVETLGNVGVICTDKTGTLTENKMAVQVIAFDGETMEVGEDSEYNHWKQFSDNHSFRLLIETGVLCNNVNVIAQNKTLVGDPVEVALMELALAAKFDVKELREMFPEVIEVPFDTTVKMMATLNVEGDAFRVSVKGALEKILDVCDYIHTQKGVVRFFNKSYWLDKANDLAAEGLRTLAFAYRPVETQPAEGGYFEKLIFLGLVGFIDPPREDVKAAIDTCHQAGIKVVMITGDHPETARNIAEAVGVMDDQAATLPGDRVIRGDEILGKSEAQLLNVSVFARVTPAQKLALVSLYQKNGYVVGMTGDGVNDAPALKKADIGIAMGIRGTEAAKEVADVILRDDQFSSIELAVRQGRIIFENIRKFVVFLLSSNLAEIISVAVASLISLPLPLLPIQILYLNLITDVFPALSLAMCEGEEDIMKRKPRPPEEPIMSRKLWGTTLIYGLAITIGVLGVSIFAHSYLKLPPEVVNNMAFYTLVLGQLFNVFNLPKRHISFFTNEVTRNPWVWGAIVLCILLTILGYVLPPLREVLSLVPLSWEQLGFVIIFSVGSLLIAQLIKRLGGTV